MNLGSHLRLHRLTALFMCIMMLLNTSCIVSAETGDASSATNACVHEYADSVCKLCGAVCENHTASAWQYDGVYHWYICEECGVMYEYGDHFVSCVDGSCRLCPATVDAGQAVEHVVNDWMTDWAGDTTNHWRICSDCGAQFDYGTHRLSCSTGACLDCGATGVNGNSDHDWDWDNWGFDTAHHWVDCRNCDATNAYDTHNNDCIGAADVCVACGQSGVTIDYVSHSVSDWDTSWQHDASNHWHICDRCGETIDVGTHGLDCATGACTWCGATGVEGETGHDWDWDNRRYDDTYHWYGCKNCDAYQVRGKHYRNCTDSEGMCSVCKQSGIILNGTSHFLENYDQWMSDNTTHWHVCDECKEVMDGYDHQLDCATGACRECGATGVEGKVEHDWNWDNYGFDHEKCWLPCKNCDEITNHFEHETSCTGEEGVCSYCGNAGVTIAGIYHVLDNWDNWQSDIDNHWHVCYACDEIIDVTKHTLDCATGACRICGATGVNGEAIHMWSEWKYDATNHWRVCETCGEQNWVNAHWLNCATGACKTCGANGVDGEINHEWDGWAYDATTHWQVCKLCGEQRNVGNHWPDCQTGICRTCGATGVSGEIDHDWDWDNWGYDADWHWLPCKNCDARINEDLHRTACTGEAGVCTECGQTGVNLNGEVSHMGFDWQGHWQYDTNNHWIVCTDCGETFNYGIHWLDCQTGECRNCGAAGVEGIIEHWPDWDTWYWDEYECWRQCTECGGESDRSRHTNMCYTEDKSECTNCGQTGVVLDGVDCHGIGDPDNWYYDDTKHWLACSWCGIPCDEGEHSTTCTGGDGVCAVCGQTGVTISGEVTHVVRWDEPWHYDTENHWRTCAACGVEMNFSNHWLNCLTGDCWCGATDVEGQISHNVYDWDSWESDYENHWHTCLDCGEKADLEPHIRDCQTGVCRVCGATDVGGDTGHTVTDWKNTWQYDETNHWHVCNACKEKCFVGEHVIDETTGACVDCGATDVGTPCEHEYETVEIQAPTCTEVGLGKLVCSLCGAENGEVELPKAEHNSTTFVTMPTCTEAGQDDYYCGDCWEYLGSTEIPALGHDMNEFVETVDPTCTEAGYTTYTCTRGCDVTENRDEVAALGHTAETVTTAATCTADGLTEEICTRCKEVIKSEAIPALGHDVNKVVKVVEATCTKAGYTIYTCSRGCAVTEKRDEVAALGHTAETVTTAATCTADGLTKEVCTRCEEVIKSEAIPALGHDVNKVVKVVAPTCTEAGYTIYTCSRGCAVTEHRDEVAALGHKAETVTTAATCTADGLTKEVCTRCEEIIKSEAIPALGHDVNKVVKAVEATCTKAGYTIYTCSRGCAVTEKRDEVAALGHDAETVTTEATCTVDGLTKEVCTRCEEIIKSEAIPALGHDLTKVVEVVAPTCTEAGCTIYTCSRGCAVTEKRDEVAALGHNTETITTEPTCIADGLAEEICTRCEEVIASEVIAALGHDMSKVAEVVVPTCTEAGYTIYTCTRGCDVTETGDEVAELGHDTETVITDPTCTEEGLIEEICTRCEEVTESATTAPLGHDMSKFVELVDPTCTEAGYTTCTCVRGCEVFEKRDEVVARGHIITVLTKDPTCTNVGYLNDYCEVCWEYMGSEVIPALGHDMNQVVEVVAPTCTEGGYTTYTCTRGCAETETRDEVAALGHNAVTATTGATCTAAGLTEQTCARCKVVLKSEPIAALGHDMTKVAEVIEATCTEGGYTTYTCTRDCEVTETRDEVAELGHTVATVAKDPTCTKFGYKRYNCSVCSQYLGSTIIPAVGHELVTTETETAIVVTCASCDYKTETVKADDASAPVEPAVPEAVAAPAVLPEQAVVKTVEEAVIEAVQTEEAAATIAIAVTEVVLENTPVVLPLPEEIQPAKVLNVSVILPEKIEEEGEIFIPEQMTITIPVDEDEIAALKDMKLVLVLSDGTLLDIPYEIVDGKLVFTTTQMGVFAFIPVEE